MMPYVDPIPGDDHQPCGAVVLSVPAVLSATPWVAAAIGAATLPSLATSSVGGRRILIGGLVIIAAGMLIASRETPVIGLLGVCLSASMFFVFPSVLWTFPPHALYGTALAGEVLRLQALNRREESKQSSLQVRRKK